MGRPLLPQLAKGFAGQLRDAIEAHCAATPGAAAAAGAEPTVPEPAAAKGLLAWLARMWKKLFG